jgi:predicted XRE-type DNA-binding protein
MGEMKNMSVANLDIRQAIKKADIKQWEVADLYGLSDGHFSRILRHELPQEKKAAILTIINDLSQRRVREAV